MFNQWSPAEPDMGMAQVGSGQIERVVEQVRPHDRDNIHRAHNQPQQQALQQPHQNGARNRREHVINRVFAQQGDRVQLFRRMVQGMEGPEPGAFMKMRCTQ